MIGQEEYNEIKKLIQKELMSSDYAIIKVGTVVSYSAPNVTFKYAGDNTNVVLPNKTGLSFVANDRIAIVQLRGDATNSFVGWKL